MVKFLIMDNNESALDILCNLFFGLDPADNSRVCLDCEGEGKLEEEMDSKLDSNKSSLAEELV